MPKIQHLSPTPAANPTAQLTEGPFYTVSEAASLLRVRVAPATIYRAIREHGFPAVKIRSRYIIPAEALKQLAEEPTRVGGCIDVATIATEPRISRELARRGFE